MLIPPFSPDSVVRCFLGCARYSVVLIHCLVLVNIIEAVVMNNMLSWRYSHFELWAGNEFKSSFREAPEVWGFLLFYLSSVVFLFNSPSRLLTPLLPSLHLLAEPL